jgi:hypothetical protein
MRENRTYGSEGGEGISPSRPLSRLPALPRGRCNGRLPPTWGGATLGADKREPSRYLTASMCQSGGVETTTNGKEGSR